MFRAGVPGTPGPEHGKAAQVTHHPTKGTGLAAYPYRLNMYTIPPIQDITVEELEQWALDRLHVLAEIETASARNQPWSETKGSIERAVNKYLPLHSNGVAQSSSMTASAAKTKELLAERRKDHISHFVLRLAFSRTEELRRRFLYAETQLFRWKLETEQTTEKEAFLRSQDFVWRPVSRDEQRRFREQLLAVHPRFAPTFDSETFVQVPWHRVPDLIEKRKVFVHRGTAWIPNKEQSSLVLAEFQNQLQTQLEQTARALPRLDEDDRLMPVLEHLSMGSMLGTSNEYAASALLHTDGGTVTLTADMVEPLVRQHAPLCMRHLQETLSSTHHLRHYSRLQYSLFLKELGLPVEEALLFWRRSFSTMSDDKFAKEHRYNIRHSYGLEGRRLNYPAKSCARILTQDPPGPQDTHGCPFRHFSQAHLSAALSAHYGIPAAEQAEILAAAQAGHYHVACTRVFELTHASQGVARGDGLGQGESVSHPNRYTEASWRLAQAQAQASTEMAVESAS
ncbi:DNA primase subunit Pri2 [Malassezia pachydermatis]|uniref:DNA primase large subunit n=1 Tax=Malassezia pachydermatis TaxID=77020 RepID=A0A0M9VPV7_9BASI|nr:dna primase large subunit [Malassezia pachydermatis]KOS14865.1 dna primase large subunit [Malassezia pachydermatis]